MIKIRVKNEASIEDDDKKDVGANEGDIIGSNEDNERGGEREKPVSAGDSKATILLAEDDEFVRDIYNRIFTMNGYKVILATNGLEALERLKEIVPDLILLDMMMPYQNGKEVFKKIKKDDKLKDVPIVFLTNVSAEDDLEQELLEQADKYLIKAHFTPKEVVAEVTPLIKNKK